MPDDIQLLALSDTARRVLGHLPVWTEDEEAFQATELEAGATESIRSYGLSEFTARLAQDRSIPWSQTCGSTAPPLNEEQVLSLLEGLAEQGLAAEDNGAWSMTQAGYELLTGPPAVQPANLVGGPVDVELHEAQGDIDGEVG
jgi:hypothetical protein